jgi:hypothetical protein
MASHLRADAPPLHSPLRHRAALSHGRRPTPARRARRALEDVRKVITRSDNIRCRRLSAESFRWSSGRCEALVIARDPTTHVYEFQLMLYTAPWPRLMSGHAILTAGVSVPTLVLLAGRLPADIQAPGDVGPPDPQADCAVDQ